MVAKGVMNWLPNVDVIVPFDSRAQWHLKNRKALGLLFEESLDGITKSKAVIAMLDGPDVESGVGFMVGYARAKGLPVVGFRTDCRPSSEKGLSVMLNHGCSAVIHQPMFDNYYLALAKDIARTLCPLLKV
jgi:nucleoside 2-deoxyribosyltransferase